MIGVYRLQRFFILRDVKRDFGKNHWRGHNDTVQRLSATYRFDKRGDNQFIIKIKLGWGRYEEAPLNICGFSSRHGIFGAFG